MRGVDRVRAYARSHGVNVADASPLLATLSASRGAPRIAFGAQVVDPLPDGLRRWVGRCGFGLIVTEIHLAGFNLPLVEDI